MAFVDFPPARDAAARAVLDAETIAALRDADALVEVVRGFPDLTGAPATPAEDVAAFAAELVLADLAVIERRLERLQEGEGERAREGAPRAHRARCSRPGRPLRTVELGARGARARSPGSRS